MGAVRWTWQVVGLVVGRPAPPRRRKIWTSTCVDVFRGRVGRVFGRRKGHDVSGGDPSDGPQVPEGRSGRAGSIVRGPQVGLASRVRRAICRDAMESNARERTGATGHSLPYRNYRGSLLHIEVHKREPWNLADFTAKLCRNSLARKRSGVRIPVAPPKASLSNHGPKQCRGRFSNLRLRGRGARLSA